MQADANQPGMSRSAIYTVKGRTAGQASSGTRSVAKQLGFRGGRLFFACVAFEGRADAAFNDAITDADELEDRAGAGVAEAGLGEAEDARVAAGSIGEALGNFVEEHQHCLLVAEELQAAAAGGN